MQAVIETRQGGTVLVEFDSEAARALAGIVEIGLQDDASIGARRTLRQ